MVRNVKTCRRLPCFHHTWSNLSMKQIGTHSKNHNAKNLVISEWYFDKFENVAGIARSVVTVMQDWERTRKSLDYRS